ncbi:hypothetical protein [Sphingobacterium sp. BS-2]|uniref:hypothetical protein n=1 Tax=Sphingobacterium sp. BS-2 TaxID=3377129 RepID=UPI0038FC8724
MNLLKLSLASLSLLTLFSCSKNETTPQTKPNPIKETELHQVKFTVQGFSQTYRPFETKASTNKRTTKSNSIDNIFYVLLDNQNLPIDTFSSKIVDSKSKLDLNLQNGEYTLRAFGYNNPGNVSKYYTKYKNTNLGYGSITFNNIESTEIGDTFIFEKKFQVSRDTAFAGLTLKRFNAKLEINILDKIPASANHIDVAVNGESKAYSFLSAEYPSTLTIQNSSLLSTVSSIYSLRGQSNQTISTNILPPDQDWSNFKEIVTPVKINVYDVNGKVIITRDILDVKIMPNTITRLSGNLFEDLTKDKTSSFAITVDGNYSKNIITQKF